MRDMMWIYAALILFLSEAWSNDTVNRNATFNLGTDVNLTCSNKTLNETIYVIWKIHLKYKKCTISFSDDGQSQDTCNDGKSIRNTSSAQSYLHIPNFSNDDVGVYKCEWVYKGGNEYYEINVAITVPPTISSWLERKDNKMVAVCKAERGKPAANITWSHTGNSSEETRTEPNGLFTVESRLELTEGMDTENLRCTIMHLFWKEAQTLRPKLKAGYVPWLCILTVAVIVVFLAGILLFAQKKVTLRRCQQSDTTPSKSAVVEDVEEVEPYASYVQRVNSIYNSSADLFT
ncbi:cell surface glycoprotein CD200 receptor 1-like [Symphorus nematophorus]